MPRVTATRPPLNPVVEEALKLRYGSFTPPKRGPFAPSPRRSLPSDSSGRPAARLERLPAPAPIPLSRLLPLDVLMKLRDDAARRVAVLSTPSQPTKAAPPTPPALEEPPSLRASQRTPMLVGLLRREGWTLRGAIEAQKAHVRFLRSLCEGCGSVFQPTRANQRACRPSCRALASRNAAAARRTAILERLDPCDPGTPE
jgi:hypothetical protein